MALVNTKRMLQKAFELNYAIGAFNISNMETIQGVVNAAQKNNSDIILQVSKSSLEYANINYLKFLIDAAVHESNINIALHLDHGPDLETVELAIKNNFSSVMYDGSRFKYKTNLENTKRVVKLAHEKNITVEAELGQLAGIEDEINISERDAIFTDPDQAVDFVAQTGIDSLAVAIGTSHGAYKFKNKAYLDFERLKKITQKLDAAGFKNFPIVLHGASSVEKKFVDMCNSYGANISGAAGIPEEMLNQAAKLSVCKINIDTDLRLAMTCAIRKFFKTNPENINPRDYINQARDLLEKLVDHKIKNVLGSVNSSSN